MGVTSINTEVQLIVLSWVHSYNAHIFLSTTRTMAKFARSFSAKHYVQSFLGRSWSTAIITRSSSTMVDTSDYSAVLPYEAIPGPKGTIRNVIDYAFSKGSFFDVLEKRYQKYGPIYSEQLMDLRVVSVFDVDAITKLLRIEKNFQMRPGFEAVAEIVEETGGTLGLASNDYNVWYPDRSLLSPKMLRPKDVNERYPILNTVSDDFVERVRLRSQTGGTMKNIEEELSYWTVESFAGFLFNQRLGFYDNPPDPEAIKFVDAARTMLEGTGKFLHGSPFYKYIKTPTYYAFKRSLLDIHVSGGQLVSKVMDSIKESSQKKTGREQSLFEWLAENDEVNSHKRMTSMLVGLMSAGIDSTSTTVLWLLYALSRDSRVQEKLYYELLTSFGAEGYVSASKIPSYLRSAVRESQRLYPVAGYVVPRVFDKDIEVLGYSIPAGKSIGSQTIVARPTCAPQLLGCLW